MSSILYLLDEGGIPQLITANIVTCALTDIEEVYSKGVDERPMA